MASDDTVLVTKNFFFLKWFNFKIHPIHKHLENAKFLSNKENFSSNDPNKAIYNKLIRYYKNGMNDMVNLWEKLKTPKIKFNFYYVKKNRAPGNTTINAVHQLKENREDGYRIEFNERF